MTTATRAKPGVKKARPADKKNGRAAKQPEPTLYEDLRDGLILLKRHLAGEEVGVTVDMRIRPALVGDAVACLKAARLAAGLTLAQVANRSGLRVETLSRLELGKVPNPNVHTLAKYAAGVGRVLTLGSAPQTAGG